MLAEPSITRSFNELLPLQLSSFLLIRSSNFHCQFYTCGRTFLRITSTKTFLSFFLLFLWIFHLRNLLPIYFYASEFSSCEPHQMKFPEILFQKRFKLAQVELVYTQYVYLEQYSTVKNEKQATVALLDAFSEMSEICYTRTNARET